MSTSHQEQQTTPPEPDKWAPYFALRVPQACDHFAREILGIELHIGSTAEEIQRVVNIYKSSW